MATIEKTLKEYLDYLEIEKNRSPKTRENYERYLKAFINFSKIKKPEDITIILDENRLMIQGEIRRITHEDESVARYTERYYGKFSRVLTLPALVKTDGAHASYINGLLKLSFLKDEHPSARRIEVDFH